MGLTIHQRHAEIPAALDAAARRYLRNQNVVVGRIDAADAVREAESCAFDGEPRGMLRREMALAERSAAWRADSWRRAKGRALGLPPRATSLYWPPNDSRYVLYVGEAE